MDDDAADPGQLEASLSFIRRINRFLGYDSATIRHLERLTWNWPRGKTLRVLDVATGAADIPLAILNWAAATGRTVEVTALDRHAATLEAARNLTGGRPGLSLLRGDALSLPFADGAFDCVMCNMFLHHLSDERAADALREMKRVSGGVVIVADLLRHYRAWGWIWLLTLCASPMVRHDARASVRQAFVRREVEEIALRAGWTDAQYYRHFGHRFVLTSGGSDR